MEASIVYSGYVGDNGRENGNYYLGFRVSRDGMALRGKGFRV